MLHRGTELLIMIVTEDEDLRSMLTFAIQQRGMTVAAASGEREVFSTLDLHPAAVLIIDAQLSETSGFELAKAVYRQAESGSTAVIILTDVGWTPSQKAAAIQQIGLVDLLVKPVEPVEVARLVEETVSTLFPPVSVVSSYPEGGHGEGHEEGYDAGRVEDEETDRNDLPAEFLADPESQNEKRQVEAATEAVQAERPELRGNLTSTSFPMLLHSLYRQRVNGAIFLLNDNVKKIIHLKDGHPSYVKSNLLSECLGKVLVREGMITETQCKQSLRQMKQPRRQQGMVLIEMGIISPQNLVVGLQLQLKTKLLDIFSWIRGEFLFKSNVKSPVEVIRLDMSNASLIAEGVRTRWDEARLAEALDPLLDRHMVPCADPGIRFQELDLTEEEQSLWDYIDGLRSVRQLLAETYLSRPRAMAVVYTLLATGVVEAHEAPVPQESLDALIPTIRTEENMRQRLSAQLLSLRRRDAFGVLGVSVGADDSQIEQSYSSLAREYHPDRFRQASGEVRQLAGEVFGVVHQAYQDIGTAECRLRYDQQFDGPESASITSSTRSAERHRQQGSDAMDDRRWEEAQGHLLQAVECCPEAADLRALLGWAIFNTAPEEYTVAHEAIQEIHNAVELNPKEYQAYLFLGRIYAKMGKSILAERQFEKAVQCNPDCKEALQELQIQRRQRPPRRTPRVF